MSQNTVSNYLTWINHQITAQETLLGHHFKAEAMLQLLLESDASDRPMWLIHNYLCALSDIIYQAKTINESLLNTLLKFTASLKAGHDPSSDGPIH